jgi:excisionase family DNA binding protein
MELTDERLIDPSDQMLRAEDIARIWGVSLPTAYRMMASGEIPVVRLGRRVRVSRRELERWIERQSQQSLSAA